MSNLSFFINNSNPLFTVENVNLSTKLGSTADSLQVLNRTVLKPISNPINVYGDFDWKNRGTTDEVPKIILREKTLAMGGLARSLANIYQFGADAIAAGNEGGVAAFAAQISDPYANMYIVEPGGGFTYHLPWLLNDGSSLRKINNSWKDETGKPLASSGNSGVTDSGIGSILGNIAGIAAGAVSPGFGVEKIQTFDQTANMSLTIKFPLYNTVSLESAFRNYCFVSLITYQNLKNRTSLISYVPPCVYEVESEGGGGVYMPLACVESINIDNIGTTRLLKEFGRYVGDVPLLLPEAYNVTISLKELIPQSANIFAATMGGKKVKVTSNLGLNTRSEPSVVAVPPSIGLQQIPSQPLD